jgi:hypothetical protein
VSEIVRKATNTPPAYLQVVTIISTRTRGSAMFASTHARAGAPWGGSQARQISFNELRSLMSFSQTCACRSRVLSVPWISRILVYLLQHIPGLAFHVPIQIPCGNALDVNEAVILNGFRQDFAGFRADDLAHSGHLHIVRERLGAAPSSHSVLHRATGRAVVVLLWFGLLVPAFRTQLSIIVSRL